MMRRQLAILLTVAALSAAPCLADPSFPNPVAWWTGDVDGGDVTGNGWDATLSGGASAGIVPGISGAAFSFDGLSGIASTELTVRSAGTVSLWVNPSALTGGHGLFGTFGTVNGHDRFWVSMTGPDGAIGTGPNKMKVNVGSPNADIEIDSPFAVGQWTHVAVTFDYATDLYLLYINGILASSSTTPRDRATEAITFGALLSDFDQSFYLAGLLDEIQFYDESLTENEVRRLHHSYKVPEPALFVLLLLGLGAVLAVRWYLRKHRC